MKDPPRLASVLANGWEHHLSASDIQLIDQCIEKFINKELQDRLGIEFKVWEWSKTELYGLVLGCFIELGLVKNPQTLSKLLGFLIDVAQGYLDNPYHSFLHAVDVTYVVYYILVDLSVQTVVNLSLVDVTVLLVSALCHDVLHPGLNNLYQVNAKTELAQKYKQQSVLENYSCDHLEELIRKHDFLTELDYQLDQDVSSMQFIDEKTGQSCLFLDYMLQVMKDAILNTDMCFHFQLMEHLSDVCEYRQKKTSPVGRARKSRRVEDTLVTFSTSTSDDGCSCSQPQVIPLSRSNSSEAVDRSVPGSPVLEPDHEFLPLQKRNIINALLHAADISNAARPFDICKKWSDWVIQEFYLQGDQEMKQNLPISPSMDRNKTNPFQISIQFNDFIARPFFESLSDIFMTMSNFVKILVENRQQWQLLLDQCGTDLPGSNSSLELVAEEERLGSMGEISQSITTSTTELDSTFSSAAKTPLSAPGALASHPTTLHPSLSRRGRRLSVAAGTIEIPEKFVQKSPQTGRMKPRSMSHGRSSLGSLNSLPSTAASRDSLMDTTLSTSNVPTHSSPLATHISLIPDKKENA